MKLLLSTVFEAHPHYFVEEPKPNTTILVNITGWGVAYTKSLATGKWHTYYDTVLTWKELLEIIDGEEVFVIGPDWQPVDAVGNVVVSSVT